MIDWTLIMDEYNCRYGTTYSSLKEFFGGVYGEYRSMKKAADVLGVERRTLSSAVRRAGLRQPRLGFKPASTRDRILRFTEDEIRNMTIAELVKATGSSRSAVQDCLRMCGLQHRKARPGWKTGRNRETLFKPIKARRKI